MTIDERKTNFRRAPSLQHKVRVIAKDLNGEDIYGVTIPRQLAEKFLDCKVIIHLSGNSIVMESGCRPIAKEIRQAEMESMLKGSKWII